MGRSKMSSLKITLLPLAICLLLSLNSQVSGKPSTKHFLIETKENAKKSSDYVRNINNSGGVGSVVDSSTNFDYVKNVNNDGHITKIDDRSTNFDYVNNIKNGPGAVIHKVDDRSLNIGDYIGIGVANNAPGGLIQENNNNHYWGKK